MKINEITVNDKDLMFETLISNIAATVIKSFLDYRHLTHNFSVSPQDVYSIDEISDIIYELKLVLSEATGTFDANSHDSYSIIELF